MKKAECVVDVKDPYSLAGWKLYTFICPHCGSPFSIDITVLSIHRKNKASCIYCQQPLYIKESAAEAYAINFPNGD